MTKEEKEEIITNYTSIYEKFNKKEIKQIEADDNNNIYILSNQGKLYKTRKYDDEIKYLDKNIIKICYLDGLNSYKITNQNIILPIDENKNWNNCDKYLNNNNCKYKKIEISSMYIVLLTNDGNVRALCSYQNLGIIPENFVNVDDITIVTDEKGIEMPYIFKGNKFIELYVI